MRRLKGIAAILSLALSVGLSRAALRDFAPRAFENGVFLDVFASYEHDDHTYASQSFEWSDLFLREKITLYSDGYVYHPRFLQYHLSLAGALKQERYEASGIPPLGWRSDHGVEYDARLFFLPEHPYNLQLFARRWEPLLREQSATQHNSVQTSHGAFYRYRKKPYFFHLSYKDDTIDSGLSSSEVTNFSIGGEYVKRYRSGNEFELAAGFNPSRFSNSFGLEGSSEESVLTSLVDLRRARLRSSLSQNEFEQDSARQGHLESERFTWVEQLTAYLPQNLRGDVLYRYQDGTNRYPQPGSGAVQELSELDRQLQLDLFHRLYESLDTTYVYLHGNRVSDSGETTAITNSLAVNYTKLIPRGRLLLGLSLSRSDVDNEGRADVLDEPHAGVAVPGSFLLGQQQVEASSVVVFLRSPLPPFDVVQLVRDVHYTVVPIDVRQEIQIVTLPPQFVVPGTYDFFVSYSLAAGTYELRADTVGYNARVQLLDKRVIPYYSFVRTDSEVVSGSFPGDPLNSTTRTLGIASEYAALQGRIEHQSLDWDVSPYEATRVELRTVGAFSATTYGNATTSYLRRHFTKGTSPTSPDPFTEQIASASLNVQKQLPEHGMSLGGGGSFTRTESLVDSRAYSLNGTLSWRIGKLELALSALADFVDTSGAGFTATQRAHQYYYATLRRRLF